MICRRKLLLDRTLIKLLNFPDRAEYWSTKTCLVTRARESNSILIIGNQNSLLLCLGLYTRTTLVSNYDFLITKCMAIFFVYWFSINSYYKTYNSTGSWKQGNGRRIKARCHQGHQDWSSSMPFLGMVYWWPDPLRWLHWQHHQSLAGFSLCTIGRKIRK